MPIKRNVSTKKRSTRRTVRSTKKRSVRRTKKQSARRTKTQPKKRSTKKRSVQKGGTNKGANLPTEMFLQIFSHIDSLSDLVNVCKANQYICEAPELVRKASNLLERERTFSLIPNLVQIKSFKENDKIQSSIDKVLNISWLDDISNLKLAKIYDKISHKYDVPSIEFKIMLKEFDIIGDGREADFFVNYDWLNVCKTNEEKIAMVELFVYLINKDLILDLTIRTNFKLSDKQLIFDYLIEKKGVDPEEIVSKLMLLTDNASLELKKHYLNMCVLDDDQNKILKAVSNGVISVKELLIQKKLLEKTILDQQNKIARAQRRQ